MEVIKIVSKILESNTFVLKNNGTAIIVDCGAEVEKVEEAVAGLKVEGIFLTHEHYDHLFYVNNYIKKFNCNCYSSKETLNFVKNPKIDNSENYPMLDRFSVEYNNNFISLNDNQTLLLQNFNVQLVGAVGHSLGSCCFLINNCLFTGDVLFAVGIGRYDFIENGKAETLKTLQKLQNIKNYEIAYHGHGENSNLEKQQKNIRLFKAMLSRK